MWIKIDETDNLPPPKQLVLIAVASLHKPKPEALTTPHYRQYGDWYGWDDRPLVNWLYVTHWMPIPKDPE